MAWAVRVIVLVNVGVIIWIWLQGGGITSAHNLGALFTGAGRLAGLLGAYTLLIQVLLLSRLPFLEWIAGFDRLTVWHRLNGKICLSLILAHIAFIITGHAMTDQLSIPSEVSLLLGSYAGMIAALIGAILLILVVASSVVIVRRRLRYEAWFLIHLMAYVGVLLTWFHQIPNGNEFLTNPMAATYWTALYLATLLLVLLSRFLQPIVRGLWHHMRVVEVTEEGPGVVSLRITGRRLNWLNARAGQFFLWRFLDRGRWLQSHPFSLSAAPDGKSLRITVKNLGNFSSRVGEIKLGTTVVAEGPFGAFTDAVRTRHRVALIAGGIGITPIRALFEEMSGDLALIYRVGREEDLIFREELERLARERGIEVHYVVGDHRAPGNEHLMSAEHLRQLLPDIAQREIYLCGPPAMMRMIEANVRLAGVLSRYIHTDRFAL